MNDLYQQWQQQRNDAAFEAVLHSLETVLRTATKRLPRRHREDAYAMLLADLWQHTLPAYRPAYGPLAAWAALCARNRVSAYRRTIARHARRFVSLDGVEHMVHMRAVQDVYCTRTVLYKKCTGVEKRTQVK